MGLLLVGEVPIWAVGMGDYGVLVCQVRCGWSSIEVVISGVLGWTVDGGTSRKLRVCVCVKGMHVREYVL